MKETEIINYMKEIIDKLGNLPSSGNLPSHFLKQENIVIKAGETKTVFTMGQGILKEIIIRSPSTDFNIIILIDDSEVLNESYSEFSVIGQNSSCITAVEELDYDGNPTGYYVVSIRLLACREGIEVKVVNTGTSSITLPHVFVDYTTS